MIKERANEDIRRRIERNGLKYWQVASMLDISAERFTVWLRTPLDPEKRKRVIDAINRFKEK